MSVTEYEQKFTTLTTFVPGMYLSDEDKARAFKEYLEPRYEASVSVHIKSTYRQVVDAAFITERN